MRVTADRTARCSGCGDDISIGDKISLKKVAGRTEVLCSKKCDPVDTQTAQMALRIAPKPNNKYRPNPYAGRMRQSATSATPTKQQLKARQRQYQGVNTQQ